MPSFLKGCRLFYPFCAFLFRPPGVVGETFVCRCENMLLLKEGILSSWLIKGWMLETFDA